jgi:hypothetical protein
MKQTKQNRVSAKFARCTDQRNYTLDTQRLEGKAMETTTLELLLKLHDDPHPWDDLWYGTEEHIANGGTFDDCRLATLQSMIEPGE